jgi:hypothetical protein
VTAHFHENEGAKQHRKEKCITDLLIIIEWSIYLVYEHLFNDFLKLRW